MKSNRWNLIIALLDFTASTCFASAAIIHTDTTAKVLPGIAALCFLIAGAGSLYTYLKKRNNRDKHAG